MLLPRTLLTALILLACVRVADAQTPQPGRHMPYHSVHEDENEPVRDELGIPRTPRLNVGFGSTYVDLTDANGESEWVLGLGAQADLHVPLKSYLLVGARFSFGRLSRTLGSERIYSAEAQAGKNFDMGLTAQIRWVTYNIELALGATVGPSYFSNGHASEWGTFVNPHVTFRRGRRVALYMDIGLVFRSWPGSEASEAGIQCAVGLSSLLWSHR